MKKNLITVLTTTFLLNSCVLDYSTETTNELNNMASPVTLLAKENTSYYGFSIVLKEKDGTIHSFGNQSFLARSIGETYNVGDTIK